MLKRTTGVRWNEQNDNATSSDWYLSNTTKVARSVLIAIGRTTGCDLIDLRSLGGPVGACVSLDAAKTFRFDLKHSDGE